MPNFLKLIRQRFGIAAPKMMVRTHIAWYWRWLGIFALLACAFVMAEWMYDAGRRFAGFDREQLQEELDRLRDSLTRLRDEASRLRAIVDASDSRMKIEQSAQAQLAAQVKTLEDENNRLKEDLAFFENLVPSERRDEKVSIQRFKVDREVLPGEYRYRLLVMQGGRRDRLFQGSLQLVVEVSQDGKDDMILLPGPPELNSSSFKLNFKYFHRLEGTFRVPAGAKVRSVQARILENGSSETRASQNINLS